MSIRRFRFILVATELAPSQDVQMQVPHAHCCAVIGVGLAQISTTYRVAYYVGRDTRMFRLAYFISPQGSWWPRGVPEARLTLDLEQIVRSFAFVQ